MYRSLGMCLLSCWGGWEMLGLLCNSKTSPAGECRSRFEDATSPAGGLCLQTYFYICALLPAKLLIWETHTMQGTENYSNRVVSKLSNVHNFSLVVAPHGLHLYRYNKTQSSKDFAGYLLPNPVGTSTSLSFWINLHITGRERCWGLWLRQRCNTCPGEHDRYCAGLLSDISYALV